MKQAGRRAAKSPAQPVFSKTHKLIKHHFRTHKLINSPPHHLTYTMIDLDRYKEILDTLTRNKTRSFLTGFGVFWGIFMLVALLGGGKGVRELLSNTFKGFANNSGMFFAMNTTKPYDGLKKGRSWSMSYKDLERVRQQVPEVELVTPLISKWGSTAVYEDKKASCVF